jgi:hypothetical protein
MYLSAVLVIELPAEVGLSIFTERRGRVANTPASYPGGPGFKSRPGDRLSLLRFRDFSQSLQANAGIVPFS